MHTKHEGYRRKKEKGRGEEREKDCMCKVTISDVTLSSMHKEAQRGPGKETCLGKHQTSSQKTALLYLSLVPKKEVGRIKILQGQPGNDRRGGRDQGHS